MLAQPSFAAGGTALGVGLAALVGCAQILGVDDYSKQDGGAAASGATSTGMVGGSGGSGGGGSAAGGGGGAVIFPCHAGAAGGGEPLGPLVPEWGCGFGSNGADVVQDLVSLPEGPAVVYTGHFEHPLVVCGGSGFLQDLGTLDGFVARYEEDGLDQKGVSFGGSAAALTPRALAANALGVTIVGDFSGSFPFGLGLDTLTSTGSDAFVVRYGSDLSPAWGSVIAGVTRTDLVDATAPRALDVATNEVGNSFVVGGFRNGVTLTDPQEPIARTGSPREAVFLALVTATGRAQALFAFGGSGDGRANAVATTSGDAVIVAGQFAGSWSFGGQLLESAGSASDMFVAKISYDGDVAWVYQFGGAGYDAARDVAVGEGGVVTVIGTIGAAVDFGGHCTVGPSSAPLDGVVFRIDPETDRVLFVTSLGGMGVQAPTALALFEDDVAVAGVATAELAVGGRAPMPGIGAEDAFVVRLDNQGAPVGGALFGDDQHDRANAVAFLPSGEIMVAGEYTAGLQSFAGVPPSQGGKDGFLVQLSGSVP